MNNLIVVAVIILIVAAGYLVLTGFFSTDKGDAEILAKCIGQKDVVLYVTSTCPHCASQKAAFGEALKYLNVVECSQDAQRCYDAGINSVPTWVIGGEKVEGVQSLERLAELTGCSY